MTDTVHAPESREMPVFKPQLELGPCQLWGDRVVVKNGDDTYEILFSTAQWDSARKNYKFDKIGNRVNTCLVLSPQGKYQKLDDGWEKVIKPDYEHRNKPSIVPFLLRDLYTFRYYIAFLLGSISPALVILLLRFFGVQV